MAFGWLNYDAMLDTITREQFVMWQAADLLGLIPGVDRDDDRIGILGATLLSPWQSEDAEPIDPRVIRPTYVLPGDEAEEAGDGQTSIEEQIAKAEMITAMFHAGR